MRYRVIHREACNGEDIFSLRSLLLISNIQLPVGSLLHSVITNSDSDMIGGVVAWIGAVKVRGEFLLKLLFE